MLERLVESWLDSASERSYQTPFCQMLAARGHVIVHSTKHTPDEFGKDVITIGPDGVPCAFQLKGNPGGRLTHAQFRAIQPQLFELATHRLNHSGITTTKSHRCYLVTNGEVDERAQRALQELNNGLSSAGFGKNKIELWTRGQLLDMATKLGSSLWPSEIDDLNRFLELLVHRGDDLFPTDKLHRLLQSVLRLGEQDAQQVGIRDLERRVTSAALMTAVGLRNFSVERNFFAEVTAWTMCVTYSLAAATKHGHGLNTRMKTAVGLARDAITKGLSAVCEEVRENPNLRPVTGFDFGPTFNARATLIVGLMSLAWLWSSDEHFLSNEQMDFLYGWLPKNFQNTHLWGEGCIPQLLAHYWFLSKTDPTWSSETKLSSIASRIVALCGARKSAVFSNPYYRFDDVFSHTHRDFLRASDPLQDETADFVSFFAGSLFHLLVRANLKQSCKMLMLWPTITRLSLRHFEPEHAWQFGLAWSKRGTNYTQIPGLSTTWDNVKRAARECSAPEVFDLLKTDHFLLLLFVMIFPYRATPNVVRLLGLRLGSIWFIEPPII